MNVRTYEDSSHTRMIQNPSCGYVCDARVLMAVADGAKDGKKGLEELPISPHFQDDVEVL